MEKKSLEQISTSLGGFVIFFILGVIISAFIKIEWQGIIGDLLDHVLTYGIGVGLIGALFGYNYPRAIKNIYNIFNYTDLGPF